MKLKGASFWCGVLSQCLRDSPSPHAGDLSTEVPSSAETPSAPHHNSRCSLLKPKSSSRWPYWTGAKFLSPFLTSSLSVSLLPYPSLLLPSLPVPPPPSLPTPPFPPPLPSPSPVLTHPVTSLLQAAGDVCKAL